MFLACKEKKKIDYVYLSLFLIMLIAVQFGYLVPPTIFPYGLSMNNFLQHISMIIMFILLSCESAVGLFIFVKKRIISTKEN